MTIKNHRCDELGACQGLGPDLCPDCDSFECEVACAPEPARPTYPFAPGVIQRQPIGASGEFCDASDGFPLSLVDTLTVLVVVLALILAGLLIGAAQ